jgi:hypothetical protein
MSFPENLCKENKKLENLDLLYLKVYKFSLASFWLC